MKHPFYTPKRAPPSRLSGLRLDFIGLEAGGDWWRNVCGEGTNVTCGYAHSIQMWPESNGSLTNIPPVSLDPLSGPTIILAPSSSYRSSTALSAPFYCDSFPLVPMPHRTPTSATTTATMSSISGSTLTVRRASRRRLSTPHSARTVPLVNCTHFPPSVAALDLSSPSSSPVLASLRVLVLSHLAELERSLANTEIPSKGSLKVIQEEKIEEARLCAREGLEMLRRIRDDVLRHFPELPFDPASVEKLLKSHLQDLSCPGIVNDIRSHFPELPDLRQGVSVSETVLAEVQSKFQEVRSHMHILDMPLPLELSFCHPLEYLPTLSSHLQSLHTHLSSLHAPELSWASFPSPSYHVITDLLDKVLSSDLLPNLPTVLHRPDSGPGAESPLEKAAREVKEALMASLDGSRLVRYVDLPMEWRNNHYVEGGYR